MSEPDKALGALLTYEYLVKNFGDRIPCYKEPTGCCASDDINGGDGCADGCEMLKCFKAGYKLAGDEITSLRAERDRLTTELEAAREALKPMALEAERHSHCPDHKIVGVAMMYVRRAAHTLEKKL